MLVLITLPLAVVAVVNKDQPQVLESLGYPKPPESMLNGESVPANILTFYALCFSSGFTAPLMTDYCALCHH